MEIMKNKVCGADIRKKSLLATILSRDGNQISERIDALEDICILRNIRVQEEY